MNGRIPGFKFNPKNNCARTMKALLNHAVKRHIIPASPLTEKITFEDVALPELELSDEERVTFLAAFDDERGFRADVAIRRREAHIVESEHFCTLKPVFVVALETGLRKSDLLNLQWEQVDFANGFIRLLMKKTKRWVVVPVSQLCRAALANAERRPS
jgi:integrase